MRSTSKRALSLRAGMVSLRSMSSWELKPPEHRGRLMTLGSAACELRTSLRAVQRAVDEGLLPVVRFGPRTLRRRRPYVYELDVEDYRRRRDAGE
jgi:hypothetical protein